MEAQTHSHSLSLSEWLESNPDITREELAEEVIRYRNTVKQLSDSLRIEARQHAMARARIKELELELDERR